MASTSHIPHDLAIDVLSRLPGDSLLRFKCVQKSWRDLIQSQEFVELQLRNHTDRSICLLAKSSVRVPNNSHKRHKSHRRHVQSINRRVNTLSLLRYDGNINSASFVAKNVKSSKWKDSYYLTPTADSDGIICLWSPHLNDIFMANPGIRKFWRLPETSIQIPTIYGEECGCSNNYVGSGFDPKTNDFKIVRILDIALATMTPVCCKAEIYTLSSNSWREIEFPDQFDMSQEMYNNWATVYKDTHLENYWEGSYYWTVTMDRYGGDYGVRGILSFDMSDEKFQFRPLPKFLAPYDGYNHQLDIDVGTLEYNSSLVLMSYPRKEGETRFDIWALDEFWVDGTLIKLFSVGPLLEVERPLLFLNSNQLLLVKCNKKMVSYNIATKQMDRLPLYCKENCDRVVVYKRSLVYCF